MSVLLYQIWRVSLRCGNILTYPSASQVVSDVWSLCVSKRNLWSHCHCVGQSRWRARRHCQLPLCSRRDSEQLWSRQHRWCVSPSVWFSSFFFTPHDLFLCLPFCQSPDSFMQSFCSVYREAYSNEVCHKQAPERTLPAHSCRGRRCPTEIIRWKYINAVKHHLICDSRGKPCLLFAWLWQWYWCFAAIISVSVTSKTVCERSSCVFSNDVCVLT